MTSAAPIEIVQIPTEISPQERFASFWTGAKAKSREIGTFFDGRGSLKIAGREIDGTKNWYEAADKSSRLGRMSRRMAAGARAVAACLRNPAERLTQVKRNSFEDYRERRIGFAKFLGRTVRYAPQQLLSQMAHGTANFVGTAKTGQVARIGATAAMGVALGAAGGGFGMAVGVRRAVTFGLNTAVQAQINATRGDYDGKDWREKVRDLHLGQRVFNSALAFETGAFARDAMVGGFDGAIEMRTDAALGAAGKVISVFDTPAYASTIENAGGDNASWEDLSSASNNRPSGKSVGGNATWDDTSQTSKNGSIRASAGNATWLDTNPVDEAGLTDKFAGGNATWDDTSQAREGASSRASSYGNATWGETNQSGGNGSASESTGGNATWEETNPAGGNEPTVTPEPVSADIESGEGRVKGSINLSDDEVFSIDVGIDKDGTIIPEDLSDLEQRASDAGYNVEITFEPAVPDEINFSDYEFSSGTENNMGFGDHLLKGNNSALYHDVAPDFFQGDSDYIDWENFNDFLHGIMNNPDADIQALMDDGKIGWSPNHDDVWIYDTDWSQEDWELIANKAAEWQDLRDGNVPNDIYTVKLSPIDESDAGSTGASSDAGASAAEDINPADREFADSDDDTSGDEDSQRSYIATWSDTNPANGSKGEGSLSADDQELSNEEIEIIINMANEPITIKNGYIDIYDPTPGYIAAHKGIEVVNYDSGAGKITIKYTSFVGNIIHKATVDFIDGETTSRGILDILSGQGILGGQLSS